MSPFSQASIGIQFISVCGWAEIGSYYYVVLVGLELVIFLLQLLSLCATMSIWQLDHCEAGPLRFQAAVFNGMPLLTEEGSVQPKPSFVTFP